MPRRPSPFPTELELEILKVLWAHGPSTVREVQEILSVTRDIGYTSVLKILQIMTEKRLVLRQLKDRAHIYRPSQSQQKVAGNIVRDLMDRVLDGSAQQLMLHALKQKKLAPQEMDELRRLLDAFEEKGK